MDMPLSETMPASPPLAQQWRGIQGSSGYAPLLEPLLQPKQKSLTAHSHYCCTLSLHTKRSDHSPTSCRPWRSNPPSSSPSSSSPSSTLPARPKLSVLATSPLRARLKARTGVTAILKTPSSLSSPRVSLGATRSSASSMSSVSISATGCVITLRLSMLELLSKIEVKHVRWYEAIANSITGMSAPMLLDSSCGSSVS